MEALKELLNADQHIKMLEERLEALEEEYNYLNNIYKRAVKELNSNKPSGINAMDYAAERVQNNFNPRATDRVVKEMNNVLDDVYKLELMIKPLKQRIALHKQNKQKLERILNDFEGLEYEVAYKKYVEGKTLLEIAYELGYSEGTIKNVSSKIKKELEEKEVTFL